MKKDTNTKITNDLRQARRRAGLTTKQVAPLLAQKSVDAVSRYERGFCLPNLQNALRLEIIYRTPVRLLFQNLFEKLRLEVDEKIKQDAPVSRAADWFPRNAEQLKREEFCFYAELLRRGGQTMGELEVINKHVVALMNTVSGCRHGKKPFSKR